MCRSRRPRSSPCRGLLPGFDPGQPFLQRLGGGAGGRGDCLALTPDLSDDRRDRPAARIHGVGLEDAAQRPEPVGVALDFLALALGLAAMLEDFAAESLAAFLQLVEAEADGVRVGLRASDRGGRRSERRFGLVAEAAAEVAHRILGGVEQLVEPLRVVGLGREGSDNRLVTLASARTSAIVNGLTYRPYPAIGPKGAIRQGLTAQGKSAAGRRHQCRVFARSAQRIPRLTDAVVDDDQPGNRVGPPPAEGGIEQQAEEDRSGQIGVNKRNPRLRLEGAVA